MRKFIGEFDVTEWEIETPSGWAPIKRVFKTIPYDVWRLECDNGLSLECADTHLVVHEHEQTLIYVKDLTEGTCIETKHGLSEVATVEKLPIPKQSMYDIEVDSADHLYYSNDIISHNTTTVATYLIYEAIFNDNMQIAILANKGDTAGEILDRVKKTFEELPWFIKPGVIEWNKRSIELSNGSKIFAASTSSSSIRGRSVNIVMLDEFAYVENDIEFYTSTYPVITSGTTTKVIITSTPNGMNLFYKIWTDAVNGKNDYAYRKYLWDSHPDRDEKWRETTIKNTDEKQFNREFMCAFEGSSNTLIEGWKIQQLTSNIPEYSDVHYNVYKKSVDGHSYVVTVDVAEGIGQDFSVIHVFDITTSPYTQVAIYRNNTIVPMLLTDILYKILTNYNEAYCIVEYNSIGKIVADSLYFDYEYENMLATKTKDSENVISGSSTIFGLRQTKKTKSVGCSVLKTLIESNTLVIQDHMTIQELSTFIKKGSSWQAENRKTDDIVMTMVIFAWFTAQPFFSDLMDIDIKSIIKNNFETLEDTHHLIFGFYDDGADELVNMF